MELFILMFVLAVAIGIAYHIRPACPQCKQKMTETFPHNDKDVYRCTACRREWIQL